MTTLIIKGKEYRIKFGYNCFCDTDLMDRVDKLVRLIGGQAAEDKAVGGIVKVKELFTVVRDLIFVGLKKHNPVENLQAVGDLLDDYLDEKTDEEERGLMQLFEILSEELMNQGFLSNLLNQSAEEQTE